MDEKYYEKICQGQIKRVIWMICWNKGNCLGHCHIIQWSAKIKLYYLCVVSPDVLVPLDLRKKILEQSKGGNCPLASLYYGFSKNNQFIYDSNSFILSLIPSITKLCNKRSV